MGKRLVLSAIETNHGTSVTFWVSEQTHREGRFGLCSSRFRATDGFEIGSAAMPSLSTELLWVRGEQESHDKIALHTDCKTFDRIKAAVAEYNAHFADKPEPSAPSMPPIITVE